MTIPLFFRIHYTMKFVAPVLLIVLLLNGCGSDGDEPIPRISDNAFLLGTVVSVTIQQRDIDDTVIQLVFSRTEEIQNRMSSNAEAYDTTEILEANRAAGETGVTVSEDTFLVLQEALAFAELTDGAFDPTVHPLILLWGIGTERAAVPEADEIEGALDVLGWREVMLDTIDRRVFLPRHGMSLDVGGIAKGYATDEGARILREEGVEHGILDFGGDIVTIGGRPDGTAWRIGIQHPSGERGRFLGVLQSRDESVLSSGAYERYFIENGVRYHHIFNPETGFPGESGLTSVTVVGPRAMYTDALSTAFFVMGLEDSLAILADLPDYEGIFATTDGELVITAGLEERFEMITDDHTLIVAP